MNSLKKVISFHHLRPQRLKNFQRSIPWRTLSILVIMSLLVSLMGLGLPTPTLAQHEGEQIAEFLPPDTDLYFTINLDLSGDQLTKFLTLVNNWWQDPNVQAKWGELISQIETESDIDIMEDVLPWLGPEIAMGMRNLVPTTWEEPYAEPEMILFVGTMNEDASEAFFFDKMMPIIMRQDPPTGPSGDYHGIDILYAPDADVYLAFPEEYIMWSNNQAFLESSLDLILSPNPTASLAGTTNFQEAQANLPSERVGMFYCAVKDIFLEAYPDGVIPPIPIDSEWVLYIPVFWMPDFIAASAYLTDVGLIWSLYYPVPEGVEVPTTEPDLLKSANLIPEDALFFFSEQNLNAGWEYILDKVEEGVSEGEEWAISFQEMLNMVQSPPPEGLGFNLSQNIFGWMDGECALAILPFTIPQDEQPFVPEILILLEVADTDAVATKLQVIFTAINIVIGGGLGTEPTTIEGVDATLITHPGMPAGTVSPGYLFLDVGTTHYLVIGSTTDALSKAVRAKNGTTPSLDEAEEYQGVLSLLPPTRVALGYISLNQIADMIVSLIPTEEMTEEEQAQFEEFTGYLPLKWALGFSSTVIEDGVTMAGALYLVPLMLEEAELKADTPVDVLVVKQGLLKTPKYIVDFSDVDPDVGNTAVSMEVDVKSLPEAGGASLRITVVKEPADDIISGFELAATDAGVSIVDVAYVIEVDKANLTAEDIGAATITMKVSRTWADNYDLDDIKIFRISDGTKEVLSTEFTGYEGNYAVFVGTYEGGLSTFGLVAVSPLATAFVISDLTISPSKAKIGESVTITATVTNTSVATGTYTVSLKLDGEVVDTKEMPLAGGASEMVSFTVTKGVAGTYSVEIDGLSDSFIVTSEAGANWALIGGIIGGVIVVAAIVAVILLRRRRAVA